jgi:hypothetical protein
MMFGVSLRPRFRVTTAQHADLHRLVAPALAESLGVEIRHIRITGVVPVEVPAKKLPQQMTEPAASRQAFA